MGKLRIVHVERQEDGHISVKGKTINTGDDQLSAMQKLVGGYLECISATVGGRRFDLWLNEEGKLIDLEPTIACVQGEQVVDLVVGSCFFAQSNSEGETISLTDEEVETILTDFGEKVGLVSYKGGLRQLRVLHY